MSEIVRMVDQLQRAQRGGAWHGPSLSEALLSMGPSMAAARPIPSAHSIWEIAHHVAVWEEIVRRRLCGEASVPSDAEDWPAVTDTGEAAWRAALEALDRGHHALRAAVEGLEEGGLDVSPCGGRASAYMLVHGVIQHDLYHAGQIVLLKKAAG